MGVNGIYGLSGSGIDVESMVKVGMMSKQSEYNKLQQSYTKDLWQKQAYNEVYNNIQTFNNSTLSQYKMESNMNAKSATTTSDAITVSANGAAPILNHKVQVNSLSTNAYLISTNKMTRYFAEENSKNGDQTSINLADVLFQGLQTNTSTGTKMANVHETDGTSSGLHKMSDTAFSLQVSADGKSYKTIKYTYKQLIDGRTFNDFVSDINSLNTNLRASYDSVNDTFSFYNKQGGASNGVYFKVPTTTDEDGNTTYTEAGERAKNFLQSMHLYQSVNGNLYGQGDSETIVTDTSTDKTYFGYESTYTSASIVASTKLTTNDGFDATGNSKMMDILFGSYKYESVDEEVTDDEGNTTTTSTFRYYYNDFGNDDTDEYQYNSLEDEPALSFNINYDGEDYEFEYSFSDLDDNNITLDSLLADIETRTGLTATLNDEGYLTISTEDTGADKSFTLTANDDAGITAKFFNRLGFYQGNDDSKTALTFENDTAVTIKGTGSEESGFPFSAKGTDGSITIDGVTYDGITDNKITSAGVTYTLLNTTDEAVTVNVTQDTDSIIDKVKSFVEDYNNLLSGLYEKYNEKQYSDYKPLTDSQRDQMTDEQIEKWEEKAKSGMLYHDQTLNKIIYKIRDAISTPIGDISGTYDSVFALGIKTTGLEGKLTLDEDKLKAALEADPDSVYNVFAKLDKNDDYDNNGVAQRLSDVLNDGTKLIKNRAGTDDSTNDDSDLGELMRNLQTRMSDFKKLLDSFEDKLYKKYDAMEVALSRLGVQLGYVTWGQ